MKLKYISAKDLIFKNAALLRQNKLYVNHDLSMEERADQKILRDIKFHLQREGMQATLKSNKLLVEGQLYNAAQAKQKFNRQLLIEKSNIMPETNEALSSSVRYDGKSLPSLSGGQPQSQQTEDSFEREEGDLPPVNPEACSQEGTRLNIGSDVSYPPLKPGANSLKTPGSNKRKNDEQAETLRNQKKMNSFFRPAKLQCPPANPNRI